MCYLSLTNWTPVYNAQGTLLGYQSFDFLGNVSFQTAFQTFLNSQPTGTIMAAAVSDALCPAAQILNATHNALATYGVTQFKSTGYRYSYAVIGVKGGSAVENYTANGSPSAFLARTFNYNSGCKLTIVFDSPINVIVQRPRSKSVHNRRVMSRVKLPLLR